MFLGRIDGSESPRIRRVSDRGWRHRRFQSVGRRVFGNSKEAISLLDGSELAGLRLVQQGYQLVQPGLDVVQVFGCIVRWQDVFVEVLVEYVGHGEKAADVVVAGFGPEPAGRDQVVVPAVFPAALLGDGLERLGSSAPALLRRLRQISIGEFAPGLHDEMLTGLADIAG